jgi:pSer/pThr/pTyr-binding forkhead associated (FHA) protein
MPNAIQPKAIMSVGMAKYRSQHLLSQIQYSLIFSRHNWKDFESGGNLVKFRLRYRAIDIKLEKGEFFVGRESTSNLVLDDAYVSRKHAVFRVVRNIVEVEDLGSRNGVQVNGTRIEGPTRLKHGDRVDIGPHGLLLEDISVTEQLADGEVPRTVSGYTVELSHTCVKCGVPLAYGLKECSNCGETLRVSSIMLLTNIAEKALNMGRHDEADRIITGILNDILERAKKERTLSPEEFSKAAEYAFLLLEATLKTQWLDYLFQLYGATRQLMPGDVVEGIYRIVNTLRYTNPYAIRTYLAELKSTAHEFDPTARFQYNRLQGLEQVISNK